MGVDLVLHHELLGFAASYVGLGLVVRHDELDRPAVDAAGLVDAVNGHLGADQSRLAARGSGSRQRLQRADLVWLRLPKGASPGGGHQHGRAERSCSCAPVSDRAAAGNLAAVPEFLPPILRGVLVDHGVVPLWTWWCRRAVSSVGQAAARGHPPSNLVAQCLRIAEAFCIYNERSCRAGMDRVARMSEAISGERWTRMSLRSCGLPRGTHEREVSDGVFPLPNADKVGRSRKPADKERP